MSNSIPIQKYYVPKKSILPPNENLPGNRQVNSGNYCGEDRKVCKTITSTKYYNKHNEKEK